MNKISNYNDEIIALIDYYGGYESLVIAIEECSELIKAITKLIRNTNYEDGEIVYKDRYSVLEEIADVLICTDILEKLFGFSDDDVLKMMDEKMKRNMERTGE